MIYPYFLCPLSFTVDPESRGLFLVKVLAIPKKFANILQLAKNDIIFVSRNIIICLQGINTTIITILAVTSGGDL